MAVIEAVRKWFDTQGILEAKGLRGRLRRNAVVTRLALGKFGKDFCLQRAAGLSFTTLLSLIPLAVLFFSFAGLFGGGTRLIDYVKKEVFPLVAPDFQGQLTEWLDQYISPTAFKEGPTGIVNMTAIIGLLLAAFGMMAMAERYLNAIWETPSRRTYLQKLTTFWVILTVSPFLLALSMWVGDFLIPKGGMIDRLQKDFLILRSIYGFMVPLTIGFLGFTTLYILLPATRVRFRSAALGGFIAAVVWELTRHAFFLYVARQAHIASFYPKLAAIPLFLVWIYVNWVIVLFGAEVGYVHQNFRLLVERGRRKITGNRYSRACLGLAMLRALGVAFRDGKGPPSVDQLADTFLCDREQLGELASSLAEYGVMVEDARVLGKFHLALAPERILLADVAAHLMKADFPHEFGVEKKDQDKTPVIPDTLTRAWQAALASFGGRTLASDDL